MRLDKFITYAGLSRSEAAAAIKAGRVAIDSIIAKNPAEKVSNSALVMLDGAVVDGSEFVYLLMNKPAGYVCEANRPDSVFTLLPKIYAKRKLSVCGRLDKDTEGMLLISDDGDFVHRIISPAKHLPKVYFVRLQYAVTESDIRGFESGLEIDGGDICRPAKIQTTVVPEEAFVTISEGMYHQIKRMFLAVKNEVLYLSRVRTGSLSLPADLPRGETIRLTPEETARIFH
ncbi:MAG: rRNA pseudouridine synthase [Ruminococcus sp.]|nr:rRNA pseudouridine synthase [Ruminococcus sp.]